MRKRWLQFFCVLTLMTSPLLLPLSASGQVSESEFTLDGQVVDTISSHYPQVSFELGDGASIDERILIDEATLFTRGVDVGLFVDRPASIPNYINDITGDTSFRDFATFCRLYITYDNGKLQIVNPALASLDMLTYFKHIDLIDAQLQDLNYKLYKQFLIKYTSDPYTMYQLNKRMPVSYVADAKADLLRGQAILADMATTDPDYETAQSYIDQMAQTYQVIVEHYDQSVSEQPQVPVNVAEDVNQTGAIEAGIDLVEEVIATLPVDLQQRLWQVRFVTQTELDELSPSVEIKGYSTTDGMIRFSQDYQMEVGIIYHEIGHMLDFNSFIYADPSLQDYTSFSQTPEWKAVFEAEWNTPGSYYANNLESFAQGFAAYMVNKHYGQALSDLGYQDNDLADRPLTKAYFDQLMVDLAYVQ